MDFGSMLNKLKRDAAAVTASSGDNTSSSHRNGSMNRKRAKLDSTSASKSKSVLNVEFPTKKVQTIFLVTPPNIQTGGPEAMHQLCDKINSDEASNVSAFMLYVEDRMEKAKFVKNAKMITAYEIYHNIRICKSLDDIDTSSSLVIWPECWTHLIDSLLLEESDETYQKCIWWLSVDNNNGKFRDWSRRDILHLHQSEYAKNYIEKNLLKSKKSGEDMKAITSNQVLPMTEFIPMRNDPKQAERLSLEHDIVFNPLKGIHYTDAIRKRSEAKFKFTAIGEKKRLSPSEVTTLLHQAKVYIDFGPHPGMDRLPREAAIANCIVITNKEGAAFYKEDVPILEKYKIAKFDVDTVHRLLKESIDNYDEKKKDFDQYREWIASQEETMKSCVSRFIQHVSVSRS